MSEWARSDRELTPIKGERERVVAWLRGRGDRLYKDAADVKDADGGELGEMASELRRIARHYFEAATGIENGDHDGGRSR